MGVLVELKPATYGGTAIRQPMPGASYSSPLNANLFGYTMSLLGQCNCVGSFWASNDSSGDVVFCIQK